MKSISVIFSTGFVLTLFFLNTYSCSAQAIAAEKSAKAAAMSDMRLITGNIEDIRDIMFLSQKAVERATDSRTKEFAQEMLTDYTGLLFPMEQLATAGTGSNQNTIKPEGTFKQTEEVNSKLSATSGADFDTMWISNLLIMQQEKYDEFSKGKENVTNTQLKMALTEAIPVIRKHITQLRSLQHSLIKMAAQTKREALKQKK